MADSSKRFALLGAAGFVAPRHFKAIKDIGGDLVAICDPHDSVGAIDAYFPDARYFREPERLERFLEREAAENRPIDYVAICTPNHLHDAHVRMALRNGAHAICEKPLVINPWNLDQLARVEEASGRRVHPVLQLRYDPALQGIRDGMLGRNPEDQGVEHVFLRYVTRRGPWYHRSWKGDEAQSGGILTNIGIHLFDALLWLFGAMESIRCVSVSDDSRSVAGDILLATANVTWLLSVDARRLLGDGHANRAITVNGLSVDFGENFADGHAVVYEHIVNGRGLRIDDARPAIELVHALRQVANPKGRA